MKFLFIQCAKTNVLGRFIPAVLLILYIIEHIFIHNLTVPILWRLVLAWYKLTKGHFFLKTYSGHTYCEQVWDLIFYKMHDKMLKKPKEGMKIIHELCIKMHVRIVW